ncbi:hypothetical protein ACFPOI_11490 [Nonomuraea angiospora]|uniref:Uncharacterized protein n=1 Tax=Nonomuraea angiospora TaxID=46172 RepID=A0ABR9MEZ1_9ACTN|nr:hypothetical protein [Nonomuraea angiospora]MBE1591145.1 hypothetical protein [Nonomuraea angiospora]
MFDAELVRQATLVPWSLSAMTRGGLKSLPTKGSVAEAETRDALVEAIFE